MSVASQPNAPATLSLGKKAGTHYTRDWVVPGPVWTVQKISPQPAFDPKAVQPVASRYTN
jgi:hypothetical protein